MKESKFRKIVQKQIQMTLNEDYTVLPSSDKNIPLHQKSIKQDKLNKLNYIKAIKAVAQQLSLDFNMGNDTGYSFDQAQILMDDPEIGGYAKSQYGKHAQQRMQWDIEANL